jgi:hypothetical protein
LTFARCWRPYRKSPVDIGICAQHDLAGFHAIGIVETTRIAGNDNPLSEFKIRFAFIARRTVGTGID